MNKKGPSRSLLAQLRKELRRLADPERAKNLKRFFKTGRGDYGEGDKFIGLTAGQIRECARKYCALTVAELEKLVRSPLHEERMTALIIMTRRYPEEKDLFYRLYLKNRKYINNWDLVDVTCPKIVGNYLLDKPRDILYRFARSKNLWERRLAIISTAAFIQKNDFADTLQIAEILIHDAHDLIHKAVGWMLREVGKKNKKVEEKFLEQHSREMPRTMLRYAIERFPAPERKKYLERR